MYAPFVTEAVSRPATVAEVKSRIEAAIDRAPGGAVAFDGDGTLWSGDVGEDFFHAILASGRITERARVALVAEATAHDLSPEGSGVELARRLHEAYLASAFPEERMCEVMTWVTAGWTLGEQQAFAAGVIASVGLSDRLHAEALVLVRWAEERGLPVHLVSASPRAIVVEAAKVVGIDPSRIAAAREAVVGAQVDAAVVRPIPYGPGKVARLREQLGQRPLYAAFGDNVFDAAMLREASVPVAIRPKPRLVAKAHEVPDLVVLERL